MSQKLNIKSPIMLRIDMSDISAIFTIKYRDILGKVLGNLDWASTVNLKRASRYAWQLITDADLPYSITLYPWVYTVNHKGVILRTYSIEWGIYCLRTSIVKSQFALGSNGGHVLIERDDFKHEPMGLIKCVKIDAIAQ